MATENDVSQGGLYSNPLSKEELDTMMMNLSKIKDQDMVFSLMGVEDPDDPIFAEYDPDGIMRQNWVAIQRFNKNPPSEQIIHAKPIIEKEAKSIELIRAPSGGSISFRKGAADKESSALFSERELLSMVRPKRDDEISPVSPVLDKGIQLLGPDIEYNVLADMVIPRLSESDVLSSVGPRLAGEMEIVKDTLSESALLSMVKPKDTSLGFALESTGVDQAVRVVDAHVNETVATMTIVSGEELLRAWKKTMNALGVKAADSKINQSAEINHNRATPDSPETKEDGLNR